MKVSTTSKPLPKSLPNSVGSALRLGCLTPFPLARCVLSAPNVAHRIPSSAMLRPTFTSCPAGQVGSASVVQLAVTFRTCQAPGGDLCLCHCAIVHVYMRRDWCERVRVCVGGGTGVCECVCVRVGVCACVRARVCVWVWCLGCLCVHVHMGGL